MRKTKIVAVPAAEGNRDSGKHFLITEMSAMQTEKWATRAFLALTSSGFNVPPELVTSGMAGFALIGLQSLASLKYEDAEPLLDEMMQCIQVIRDPKMPNIVQPLVPEIDIEEISTLSLLRTEVFKLHVNFSLDAVQSFLKSALNWINLNSKTIQTSQDQSAQPSLPEKQP